MSERNSLPDGFNRQEGHFSLEAGPLYVINKEDMCAVLAGLRLLQQRQPTTSTIVSEILAQTGWPPSKLEVEMLISRLAHASGLKAL